MPTSYLCIADDCTKSVCFSVTVVLEIMLTHTRKLVSRSRLVMISKTKEFLKLISRHMVFIILSAFAASHCWFLLSLYLHGAVTLVTNATFHNEHNPLQLPEFFLCFAKVFTYTKLSPFHIQWLYGRSMPMRWNQSRLKYDWKLGINDVILDAMVNGKHYEPALLFANIFYLPTQTCFRSKHHANFTAGQAGMVHTFELIVNAAVYDDITISYDSPLTYLSIVPYFSKAVPDGAVPNTRSSVHVSPGRLSAIGFSWTEMDTSRRSKRDQGICRDGQLSKEDCLSRLYKSVIRTKCGRDVAEDIDLETFVSCGLQTTVDDNVCLFEPCKKDSFRFMKSEGYIKFDSRLSTVHINNSTLQRLKTDVSEAMQKDSQFNPDVTRSFREIAHGMDDLNNNIAQALSKPQGYICSRLLSGNYSLVSIVEDSIPNVIAEREYISNLRKAATAFSRMSLSTSMDYLIQFARTRRFMKTIPYILPIEIKNTESKLTAAEGPSLVREIRHSGQFVSKSLAMVNSLRQQWSLIINNFKDLQFSRFIDRYSSRYLIHQFNHLLVSVIDSAKQLKQQLFHGSGVLRKSYFAHQDEGLKTTYTRGVRFSTLEAGRHFSTVYPNSKAMQYALLLDGGFVSPTNGTPHLFQAVYGHSADLVDIPVMVDLFCGFYHNYLALAERFHGCELSFSITQFNTKLELLHDYAVFVLSQLFVKYDTSVLFSTELDALDGAERRSCARLSGVNPIYVDNNTSFSKVVHQLEKRFTDYFSFTIDNSLVKRKYTVTGRAQMLIRLLLEYSRLVAEFEKTSLRFESYYNDHVTPSIGPVVYSVMNLRKIFAKFHTFNIEKQSHKIFLVNRLRKLADLIHGAMHGDGETLISHYLSKKGKILIGEIQIEMSRISRELFEAESDYWYYRKIIRGIPVGVLNLPPVTVAVIKGVMAARFHSDVHTQQTIIQHLSHCNERRWSTLKQDLGDTFRMMAKWLINTTMLVTRAKRFSKSLELSKSFLRKNLMHVSLYYDSMTAFDESGELLFSKKSLLSKLGAALRIYIRMTMFRMLNILSSTIASVFFGQSGRI